MYDLSVLIVQAHKFDQIKYYTFKLVKYKKNLTYCLIFVYTFFYKVQAYIQRDHRQQSFVICRKITVSLQGAKKKSPQIKTYHKLLIQKHINLSYCVKNILIIWYKPNLMLCTGISFTQTVTNVSSKSKECKGKQTSLDQ